MMNAIPMPYFWVLAGIFFVATLIALLRPRSERNPRSLFALVGGASAALGILFAPTMIWSIPFWIVVPYLGEFGREGGGRSGAFMFYQTVGNLVYIAAALTGRESLLAVAVWIRLGLFPFHASLLSLAERGSFVETLSIVGIPTGLIGLLRFYSGGDFQITHVMVLAAAIGAFYFAALATVQLELRRLSILICLIGMSFAVASSLLEKSVISSAVQWFAISLGATGIASVAWLVHARVGDERGGLARNMPTLAALYLIFGLAIVGIPVTMGAITSDILVHVVWAQSQVLAIAVITALSVSAVALYRGYVRVFLGAPRPALDGLEIHFHERFAMALLLASLILPVAVAAQWAESNDNPHENQLTEKTPETSHAQQPEVIGSHSRH